MLYEPGARANVRADAAEMGIIQDGMFQFGRDNMDNQRLVTYLSARLLL